MTLFLPATREQLKLRMGIDGPAKSGKSYTGLRLMSALCPKLAAIDTEHRSLSKYVSLENPDGGVFKFDVLELKSFDPRKYIEGIRDAAASGYDGILVDSLSHAWFGKDGELDQVDKIKARNPSGNSFFAWRDVSPLHNELVDTIIRSDLHIICTLRSQMEYMIEPDDNGKMVPRRLGLAPVQRKGMEYEFDLIGSMDMDHKMTVLGSRCSDAEGVHMRPGIELAMTLKRWLETGVSPEDARKMRHHPSWENGGRDAWFSAMAHAGVTQPYEEVCRIFDALSPPRPRPSEMPDDQRDAAMQWVIAKFGTKKQQATLGKKKRATKTTANGTGDDAPEQTEPQDPSAEV